MKKIDNNLTNDFVVGAIAVVRGIIVKSTPELRFRMSTTKFSFKKKSTPLPMVRDVGLRFRVKAAE